ncbi:MAG: peptidylprolyl isomerase [Pirellulaceae bacterium]|nr:peptidylprolyl isomerase [Pirellulaceae bacterium]
MSRAHMAVGTLLSPQLRQTDLSRDRIQSTVKPAMVVAKDKVVAIDYMLKDNDGQVLDQSDDGQPLNYLHGAGMIITGLESALEGKVTGDELQVTIEPADGYGEFDDGLRQQVPRSEFADIEDLAVGMQFRVNAEDDDFVVVTVVDVNDEEVTVDGNHQLAGVTLHFDVKVREIRDATEEEIEHGHPHGPGGHEH